MKKENFKAEMAIGPCARTLARTKLNENRWISKVSGLTFDVRQATEILIHTVNCEWAVNKGVKVNFKRRQAHILEALNNLTPIDEYDCEIIYKYNEDWKFFRSFFDHKRGEKIRVRDLHAYYTKSTDNTIALREFYKLLRLWLSETDKEYKFYNRRLLASVKVF